RSAVDQAEQYQRYGQRNDGEIDVADAPEEGEVAHQNRHHQRRGHGGGHRQRAVAQIDRQQGIYVGANAEESRLAQRQYAAYAPYQPQAQGQHGQHREHGKVVQGIDFRNQGYARDEHQGRNGGAPERGPEQFSHQMPRLKTLPVMPEGSTRSSTMAVTSSITSPNTEVLRKVVTWLTVPSKADDRAEPVSGSAPPRMTVMKALAI